MIQSTFYAQHNPCRKRKPRKKYIKKQRRQAEAMVAQAAAMTTSSSHLLFTSSRSLSRLSPFQLCVFDSKTLVSYPNITSTIKKKHGGGGGLKCMAVNTASEAETKKSRFEIQTLTVESRTSGCY
jgi:hypothetical protein